VWKYLDMTDTDPDWKMMDRVDVGKLFWVGNSVDALLRHCLKSLARPHFSVGVQFSAIQSALSHKRKLMCASK